MIEFPINFPIKIRDVGFAARVGSAVVNNWAGRAGVSGRMATRLFLASITVCLAGSSYVAWRIENSDLLASLAMPGPILAMALVAVTFLGAMLLSMVMQVASENIGPSLRSLRSLPVSTKLLNVGLDSPGYVVTGLFLLVFAPPAWVATNEATGYGMAHAIALMFMTAASGMLAGRLVFGLFRHVFRSMPRLNTLTGTFSIGFWLIVVASTVFRGRALLTGDLTPERLVESSYLVWPADAAFAISPTATNAAAALGCLLALLCVVVVAYASTAAFGIVAPPALSTRLKFNAHARAPLYRMELARLLRHPRTVAWAASSVLVLSALLLALWFSGTTTQQAVGDNLVLVSSQLLSYQPLLLRGLSRRDNPYPLMLGFSPRRWSFTLFLAAATVVFSIAIPFYLAASLIMNSAGVIVAGIGFLMFVIPVASLVAAQMTPNGENAGSEMIGSIIVFAATAVTALGISKLLDTDSIAQIASLLGVLGVGLVAAAPSLEHRRWTAQRTRKAPIQLLTLREVS